MNYNEQMEEIVKKFDTKKRLLLHSPNLLLSIAIATISKVFPAPTSCASKVFPL